MNFFFPNEEQVDLDHLLRASSPTALQCPSQPQARCLCVCAGLHFHGRVQSLLFRCGFPHQAGQSHKRPPVCVWAGPHPSRCCVPVPAHCPSSWSFVSLNAGGGAFRCLLQDHPACPQPLYFYVNIQVITSVSPRDVC